MRIGAKSWKKCLTKNVEQKVLKQNNWYKKKEVIKNLNFKIKTQWYSTVSPYVLIMKKHESHRYLYIFYSYRISFGVMVLSIWWKYKIWVRTAWWWGLEYKMLKNTVASSIILICIEPDMILTDIHYKMCNSCLRIDIHNEKNEPDITSTKSQVASPDNVTVNIIFWELIWNDISWMV